MKKRGKKLVTNCIKVFVMILSIVGTMVLSNVEVTKAEEIIHTHIWATKYDENKHWEYCTVCKKTRNEEQHKCVDNWAFGYESCHLWNGNNFSTRICSCGYNYIYHKPHGEVTGWHNTGERLVHYKKCSVCNDWTTSGRCRNAQGYLSCKNPGTCVDCGVVATKDYHYITKDGKCRDCGTKYFDITPYTLKYASNYSSVTINFTFKPIRSGVEFTGVMGAYCGNANYKDNKWTYVKKSDGSVEYTGVYTFNPDKQRKSTLNFLDRRGAMKINGTGVYIDSSIMKIEIWQDHTKPEVNEVKQVDQKTHNNWATIKELTITGKEDLSKVVTISILDKQTNDVIVNKAKTTVTNGKYSYKCTPPLEGPESGRDYIVRVEDEIGNTTDKVFTVYRTDCRAPMLRSEKEFTEWSKTKNLEFELTDYGAGSPQSSIVNQVSYKDATSTGDSYKACYTFTNDNYGVNEYNLYLRDGLGNAGKEVIKVGKIDNTKPTITDVKGEKSETGAKITVIANDINSKLNAEGSGVSKYAIVNSESKPKDEEWQESNEFTITTAGKYYVWVKDLVGNMADVQVIKVGEDFSVEVDPEEKIVVDEPEEEKYDKVKEDKEVKEEKKDSSGDDSTPKTGDATPVVLLIALVVCSGITMIVIRNKKRRYNR